MKTAETAVGLTWRWVGIGALAISAALVFAGLVWAAAAFAGNPDPTDPGIARHMSTGAIIIGAGILVFREGLETILVLAAITASMVGANAGQRQPVATGGLVGLAATVATWFVAVAILDSVDAPEFEIQAATGLVAVVVLLIVMNWFFHKFYWTGWIQTQNRAKRRLSLPGSPRQRLFLLALRCSDLPPSIARALRSSSSCRRCDCSRARGSSSWGLSSAFISR